MVLKDNPHVQIQHDGLVALTESIISLGGHATEWDADGWHYAGSQFQGNDTLRQERVALYVLALDAINFCFWPHDDEQHNNNHSDRESSNYSNSLEYDHLAIALRKLAERDDNSLTNDDYFFNPNHLSELTVPDMKAALEPELQGHYLPNNQERCRLWNELGHGLLFYYQGTALSLITAAQDRHPIWLRASSDLSWISR
ncbi:putative Queuosine [Fragilaria crotonensis]|nr:putative Queuosine [Fragilaria crotonensis]